MSGVRIRPQAGRIPNETLLRGPMVVVNDITRPFPLPKDGRPLEQVQPICRICGVQHFVKPYHIQIDPDGTAIVSETIWENLQKLADCGGFELANEVKEPPAQTVVLPTAVAKIKPADM